MIWAVVMAGGQGTRFWPESRRSKPKQFLKILSNKTLLEETLERLHPLIPSERIVIVTQEDKISLVRRLAGNKVHVIGEPVGRNTAPCLILLAAWIKKKDPQAVLVVLPSDHRIKKAGYFRKALQAAASTAMKSRKPVTFGIKPEFPSTGYGYLELEKGSEAAGRFRVRQLKCFHEKPSLRKAQLFLKKGNFLWNSGMFIWKASEVLLAAGKYLPDAKKLAEIIVQRDFKKSMKLLFKKMPSISIDYGLMEKMKGQILCIPADFGWSDVGSWKVVADFSARDRHRNTASGETIFVQSSGNFVKNEKRLTALVGVQDLVIVDTEDALLVCHKSAAESIKVVIDELKLRKKNKLL